LPLLNPSRSERGEGLVTLLKVGVTRAPCYLDFRCTREDKAYFEKKKKNKKSSNTEDRYLDDFSEKYFERITEPGLKVISGTQTTNPILKVFYHEEDRELKFINNIQILDKRFII